MYARFGVPAPTASLLVVILLGCLVGGLSTGLTWWAIGRSEAPTNPVKLIAVLADEGTAIQEAWIRTNDTATLTKEHGEWIIRVVDLLRRKFDSSYEIQFRNAHGSAMMGCPAGHSIQGCGYWQDIQGKRDLLMTMISELRERQ